MKLTLNRSLRFVFMLIFILVTFSGQVFAQAKTGIVSGELRRWHTVTITFDGPATNENATPNPFLDYRLTVTFTNGATTYTVPGYYAADGNAAETSATSGNKWRVQFAPPMTGTWTYSASFRTGQNIAISTNPTEGTATAFDSASGTFNVTETDKSGVDFRGKGWLRYVGKPQLQFAGTGEYYLKGGADSPENFLAYADFDGTYDTGGIIANFLHRYDAHAADWVSGDPSWKGGKGRNIVGALNYLSSKGVNSVYFLTYNLDGGDGQDTWMWTSHTVRDRFDVSKLAQWEIVFSHMDRRGIQLHVVTQEMENDRKLGGSSGLNNIRKLYYRELVARFSHHLAVSWNLGEENTNSDAERIQFAQYIRALDPYDHPITVHTNYNQAETTYNGLFGNPNFEATSLQGDAAYYNQWAINLRQRSQQAGRPWVIYGDEQGPAVNADMSNINQLRRDALWGNLMGGGGGIEWYFGYQGNFGDMQSENFRIADPLWTQTAHALSFFRNIPFWEMQPNNALASGNNPRVLVKPGEIYAVYLPSTQNAQVNLERANNYAVQWYDPRNGGALQNGITIGGPGFKSLGQPPSSPDQDWIALVKNTGAPATGGNPGGSPTAVAPTPGGTGVVVRFTNPSSNGGTISNRAQTNFQVVAYDQAVGSSDGAGIKQVDFELYAPDNRLIHNRTEATAVYCAFGNIGTAPCDMMPDTLYNSLTNGTYSIRARATSSAGVQSPWVTATFNIASGVAAASTVIAPVETVISPTLVPPTSVVPMEPTLLVNVRSSGTAIAAQLQLLNVAEIYGLEVTCTVDPSVLSGVNVGEGDGFNSGNSFFANTGFQADTGRWLVAATRLQPNPSIAGNTTAFTLNYTLLKAGRSNIDCSGLAVDQRGEPRSLEIINGRYEGTDGPQPTVVPTAEPTLELPVVTATLEVTEVAPTITPEVSQPTPIPGTGLISGVAVYQRAVDNAGIKVELLDANQTVLASIVTNANGAYQFTDVSLGTYFLRLSAPQHLLIIHPVTVANEGQTIQVNNAVLPAGDVDNNSLVDLADATYIGANFSLQAPPAPTSADLNRDAIVNVVDLTLLGSNFGRTAPISLDQ